MIICFSNSKVNVVACEYNMWFQGIEEYHIRYIDSYTNL